MPILLDLLYFAAAPVLVPALALKSLRTGKYRSGFAARLGFGPTLPPRQNPRKNPRPKVLLLHCVSVGELNSVTTLIAQLLAADPHLHIALSTTTDTGTARARSVYPPSATARVHPVRYPLDFSFAVEHFLDRLQPDAIALVELETWPNFLAIAQSRRIPVVLINGRLSEKSFPRYRLIKPVMAAMLRKLFWIGVQTPTIATRFLALGAPKDRLQILPTLKYDNAPTPPLPPASPPQLPITNYQLPASPLARAMGLTPGHRLFVAGSTGPGEQEPLLEMYQQLRPRFPALRLAIAPRHPEVVAQVVDSLRAKGLQPVLRTERPDSAPTPHPLAPGEVFVLNTMGELRKLYALAFAVFVGRSLFKKGGGGSDMIEVAALGKPCCFGPFTSNFAEVVELLLPEKTALIVRDAPELTRAVETWLTDENSTRETGRRAQEVINRQRGSTQAYITKLLEVIQNPRSAQET